MTDKIEFLSVPDVSAYADFSNRIIRQIAGGLGIRYDLLAADYAAAERFERIAFEAEVDSWVVERICGYDPQKLLPHYRPGNLWGNQPGRFRAGVSPEHGDAW